MPALPFALCRGVLCTPAVPCRGELRSPAVPRRGVLCTPAERPQAFPTPAIDGYSTRATTGRPYTLRITPSPVGASCARPRNDHRSFPTTRNQLTSHAGGQRPPLQSVHLATKVPAKPTGFAGRGGARKRCGWRPLGRRSKSGLCSDEASCARPPAASYACTSVCAL